MKKETKREEKNTIIKILFLFTWKISSLFKQSKAGETIRDLADWFKAWQPIIILFTITRENWYNNIQIAE